MSLCTLGYSQSVKRHVAASYTGAGAYSEHHNDVFSFTANQAALASLSSLSAGVYGERRFMMDATNLYSAAIAIPTRQGNFGFQADYFGYKSYNESQLGLAYARSLGERLDLGIKFNYYSFRIPAYEQAAAVNFEIGAIAHLTPQLHAGINIYNPVGGKLTKSGGEKLGSVYTFGIGYEPGKTFLITAEIVKEEDHPVNVNAAMQYNFEQRFFARLGISSDNASPFAGAGVYWNSLRLDVSASYHPQLGLSPGIMLIYQVKRESVGNE